MDQVEEDKNLEVDKFKFSKRKKIIVIFMTLIGIFILVCYLLLSSPSQSKTTTVHVSPGQSLNSIILDLKDKNVIRSSFLLKGFIVLFKSDRQITKGDYLFNKDLPVFSVAWQIAKGNHNIEPIKITFKEGITNEEMAVLLENKLPNFNKDLFVKNTNQKQGYLFPDTYSFYPLSTTEEVINEMSLNFKKRISSVEKDINTSGKKLEDVIIMASILEKEAHGQDDASTISGILWNRIKKGMLLQVDAEPSTYKNKGLPGYPIDNPGLSSIKASLNPVDSLYLFYLHDSSGQVHFAQTFAEHRNNIKRYLK